MHRLLILLALLGCGDSSDLSTQIDAPAPDADLIHCPEAPPNPTAPGHYVVFIASEGLALTTGCGDHSATNCTTMLQTDATIPAAFPTEPSRNSVIAEIIDLARTRLVPYSVDLVTTRPAAGAYNMIVFGGDSSTVGLPDSPVGVAPFNCGDMPDDHVALLFDRGLASVTKTAYANQILFQIGTFEGLTLTRTPDDCECAIDTECQASTGALCKFNNAPTSTMFPDCGRGATQDGPLLLKNAFGCRT